MFCNYAAQPPPSTLQRNNQNLQDLGVHLIKPASVLPPFFWTLLCYHSNPSVGICHSSVKPVCCYFCNLDQRVTKRHTCARMFSRVHHHWFVHFSAAGAGSYVKTFSSWVRRRSGVQATIFSLHPDVLIPQLLVVASFDPRFPREAPTPASRRVLEVAGKVGSRGAVGGAVGGWRGGWSLESWITSKAFLKLLLLKKSD